MLHPLRLVLVGFVLVVGGWAVLVLVVIGILPSLLSVSIVAFLANTVGLFLGLLGGAGLAAGRRRDKDPGDE